MSTKCRVLPRLARMLHSLANGSDSGRYDEPVQCDLHM